MKFKQLFTISTTLVIIFGIHSQIFSQDKGNITIEQRELPSFTGLDIGGLINVYIEISDEQSVKIETEENKQEKVTTTVKDNILTLGSKGIKTPSKLNAYVKLPYLKYLAAGGATSVKGESLFEGDEIIIKASGASTVKVDVDVEYLESVTSGAADLTLSGRAAYHKLNVSGAGSLKAKGLVTEKSKYDVSGAGDAYLNVTGELDGTTSGSGDVKFIGDPETTVATKTINSDADVYAYSSHDYSDSTKVKVAGINVEVYESNDSVKVIIGERQLRVDENGNVELSRCKKNKFNGHWAGFEMGMNGYFNPDYNMSFDKETEYMDLRMDKSWAVYINFYEQNIPLSKNQKWGILTGIGTNWHNYRFSKDTRLNSDSSELIGYIDKGISIRKSKLSTWYLNIPLLFEFQTNRYHNKTSFHFTAGMIMGIRLSSHTKKYYDERNKEFEVTKYNPETYQYETVYTAVSPDYSKAKSYDDFYLNPFKWDATVRIGWGVINLFATYSVNTMFKTEKGPELYPWTVGITFVNF